MRIFGIVLAGGQGRRMGGADKALLPLAGKPLITHVIARFHPQVEDLAISANGDPARLGFTGLSVLADHAADRGPMAGVLAGLDWAAAAGATALVTVAVDTPFLPEDLVPRLCLAAEDAPEGLAMAQSGGRDHPTFALWPVAMRGRVADFLASGEKASIRALADRHGAARAVFPEDGAFDNLNRSEDLQAASGRIAGLQP
jgi:molybdopterin-guanine dinucleotide biosynthesis protein A